MIDTSISRNTPKISKIYYFMCFNGTFKNGIPKILSFL